MEANRDKVTRQDLRHDRHTVSLLTDHLCFRRSIAGRYWRGEVAEAAEENIRETCNELDIEIIDMAMNVDHVHLFIKKPFRKSVYGKKSFGQGWDVVENRG